MTEVGIVLRDDDLGTVSPEMLGSWTDAAALTADKKNSLVGKPRG